MPIPETVQQIRAARAAHKAWVTRAEALVSGLPLDKEQVPVVATECEFGKWYYGSGSSLYGFSVYSEIEPVHEALHLVYAKIFTLLFEEKPSSLQKLFGQSKSHKKESQQKAKLLLPELQDCYEKISMLLDKLEVDAIKQIKQTASENTIQRIQNSTFRDVKEMMESLEKDVDSWLKK